MKQERKDREELEIQLAAAKREAGALRAALNAARAQRDDLEAELMEAALDVLDSQRQRADYSVRPPTLTSHTPTGARMFALWLGSHIGLQTSWSCQAGTCIFWLSLTGEADMG